MSKTPAARVDDLLGELAPVRKHVLDDNPELVSAVTHFLDLKAADDARVKGITLRWFYLNKLRDAFDGPKTDACIRRYIADVLKRDFQTGKPLEGSKEKS